MNSKPSMAGLASLVQSRGRNGDSVLVHMTPGEVQGLQSLALAAGGRLTINPDTGLYEASFLKKLLPTLLGFGLNFLFPGLGAIGSGLLVGAGETIRTGGDLGKGLMAGLGAFGGAGLGSALSGVGAAATDASTKMLAQEAAQGLGKEAGAKAAQEAVTNQIRSQAANQATTLGGRLSNLSAGAKELFTGGQNLGLGGFGALKATGSAMGMPAIAGLGANVSNAMTPDMEIPGGAYEVDDSYYQSYGYDPAQGRFLGGQWRKGYPGFPTGMAGGGIIPRPNFSYPLAQPSQATGAYEMRIDPFTGEERFAEGGDVPDPEPRGRRFIADEPAAPPAPPSRYAEGFNLDDPAQRAALNYQQQRFSDTLSIMNMNPGMSYNKALEYMNKAQPDQPKMIDPSANFSWGADLAYDPSIYAKQFDWQGYIAANPDLAKAGIDTPWEAATHYSNYGKNENRAGVSFLNPNYGQEPSIDADMRAELRAARMAELQGQNQAQPQPTAPTPPAAKEPTRPPPATPSPPRGVAPTPTPPPPMPPSLIGGLPSLVGTPAPSMRPPQGVGGTIPYTPPTMISPTNPMYQRPQDLEKYYQGLLTPPRAPSGPSDAFSTYLRNLNAYLTSPVAPYVAPTPAPAPAPTPSPGGGREGEDDRRPGGGSGPIAGGGNTYVDPFSNAMRWDNTLGRFVPKTGSSMGEVDPYNPFPGYSGFPSFAGGGTVEYAAAGKFLSGPGDGMSDDIRANINGEQEARLADGEFVIPADVVSHIGNGSSDAGAKRLHSMMAKVRKARTGRTSQAPEINPDKYLPA